MTSFRMPEAFCPNCDTTLDGASSEGEKRPDPGDYSICFNCGCVLRYTPDLNVRPATEEEAKKDGVIPNLRKEVAMWNKHH